MSGHVLLEESNREEQQDGFFQTNYEELQHLEVLYVILDLYQHIAVFPIKPIIMQYS